MDGIGTRPLRDRHDLEAVLRAGFDLIGAVAPGLRHRLVGTAAACLQGVDVPVGDVDILVGRRQDVEAVAEALADVPCVTAPRWIEVSRQYFARYSLDGVHFEVSTVEVPCEEDGWEGQGPGPWRHYVPVDCGGHRIDCVSLELRLTTEFLRDRPDRYEPILAHLGTHGADLELLHRSMTVREVPEAFAHLIRGLQVADRSDRHVSDRSAVGGGG
ncbi:hypothetical protein [Streptomyces sp. MP131-18]|uniref:hypothetical protein n=1 Tax=Streptomyces sp. MP131-18 TaxID=1857892 RepID=UPI00117DA559|nr:hypothetical protein [Streptomyces sp. MP131-18]